MSKRVGSGLPPGARCTVSTRPPPPLLLLAASMKVRRGRDSAMAPSRTEATASGFGRTCLLTGARRGGPGWFTKVRRSCAGLPREIPTARSRLAGCSRGSVSSEPWSSMEPLFVPKVRRLCLSWHWCVVAALRCLWTRAAWAAGLPYKRRPQPKIQCQVT